MGRIDDTRITSWYEEARAVLRNTGLINLIYNIQGVSMRPVRKALGTFSTIDRLEAEPIGTSRSACIIEGTCSVNKKL